MQRELVEARRAVHGERGAQVASILNLLGQTLHDAGRLDEALDTYRQAIAADPDGDESLSMATTLGYRALAQADAGQSAEAEKSLRRALALRARLAGEDDLASARLRVQLGRLLLQQRRDGEALPLFERALAVLGQRLPPQHSDPALVRLQLAELALRRRALPEADAWLQQAAVHEARLPAARRPLFERVRALRAEARGERSQSLGYWKSALQRAEQGLAPTHPVRLAAALDLAEALAGAGQAEPARSLLAAQRRALQGYGERSPFAQRAAKVLTKAA
jgi:tetratricopeptide (TPR) repeat protein